MDSDERHDEDEFGDLPRLELRPEDLWDLHYDLGWGTRRIARYLGISRGELRKRLRENEIPVRQRQGRRIPWYLAVPRLELVRSPDPASFWRCRRSSRSGVGCLLCPAKDELPADCDEDCARCPTPRASRCPCANDAFGRPRWSARSDPS